MFTICNRLKSAILLSLIVTTQVYPCKFGLPYENEVIEVPVKPQVVKYEVLTQPNVLKLKCNIQNNSIKRNRIVSVNEIRWERKKCGYGLHLENCSEFNTMSWISVMCKNSSKFCDGYILKLENPTASDSGYYRCLYKNYMSKQFKVYKMFHVDIYDPKETIEILDEPVHYDNQTVQENETVTFRCRAQSLSPLHMVWVKFLSPDAAGIRPVRYGSHTYEVLDSREAFNVADNLYISKLTIRNSQILDNGIYYCIIISVNDAQLLKNKSMSLTVTPRYRNNGILLQAHTNLPHLYIRIMFLLALQFVI